jgi:hypothetical protein
VGFKNAAFHAEKWQKILHGNIQRLRTVALMNKN